MTIKHSRAQRRHDRARLKEKRQFHWGYGHKDEWVGRTPDVAGEINHMSPAVAGMVISTPAPCSCSMCGNPRRNSWGENPLTMQEQKASSAYKDQVEEYYSRKDYFYDYDYYGSIGQYDFYDEYGEYGDDPADDWYLRWMYIKG